LLGGWSATLPLSDYGRVARQSGIDTETGNLVFVLPAWLLALPQNLLDSAFGKW